MKEKRSRSKRSRFWLIYTISTVVLLFAVIISLFVFYDFMDAFEESQPQSPADAAKKYAVALTSSDVEKMLKDFAESEPLLDEASAEKIIAELVSLWNNDKVFCKRLSDLGNDEAPVYSVISGGREMFRLTLSKQPTGRYGFDAWYISDTEVKLDGLNIYTITAPAGAVVTVNGTVLDDTFVTEKDLPYSYRDFEKGLAGLPTATSYETGLLEDVPSVSAKLGDTILEVTYNDYGFTAKYPSSLLYSCTVKVPEGANVTSNGFDIAAFATKTTESAFGGLIAEGLTVPSFDVYTLDGLFAPLSGIVVTENGVTATHVEAVEGNAQTVTVEIASVDNAEVASFAKEFTKAYFYYTSRGYQNTAQNLAAALSYVKSDTELYRRIKDSKVGYDFVTPITSEVYNKFEVTRTYPLEDGSFIVMIEFDIDHQIYSQSRSYKGEISLHVVNNGEYKIANMVINND